MSQSVKHVERRTVAQIVWPVCTLCVMHNITHRHIFKQQDIRQEEKTCSLYVPCAQKQNKRKTTLHLWGRTDVRRALRYRAELYR